MTSSTIINNKKNIFKCDQHSAIISDKLQSFYIKNEFFDTVIKAGSICVQTHRVVLCTLSEYFMEIFRSSQSTSSRDNQVVLNEIQASTLKPVIDFIYSGEIELSLSTAEGLLRTASFLRIQTLVDCCNEFIEKNMNFRNSLHWFRLANELSLPKIKANSLKCIYKEFDKVSKEKALLMLSLNELKSLLKDKPHEKFEKDVFLSIVAWINFDNLNREHLVLELLSLVRFRALTPKFIFENRKSVCKTIECYELVCSWLQWHLSPETRQEKPEKLAVTRVTVSDEVKIQTFNPEANSWPILMETRLPTKKLYPSIIVVEGKLIAVGGLYNNSWSTSVECLNLQTLKWINLSPMIKPRMRCQLADLNGYLCAFGGYVIENSISMEIYSFSKRNWLLVKPASEVSRRSQITAHNGILYILDFENGFLQSYDVSSNEWTLKAVEKSTLHWFGFSAIEGFLYVIGGCYSDYGEKSKTVLRYDLNDDSWREMAGLSQARSCIRTKVFGNKIIICDCFDVDEYNLDTDTWNILSPVSVDDWYGSFEICSLSV